MQRDTSNMHMKFSLCTFSLDALILNESPSFAVLGEKRQNEEPKFQPNLHDLSASLALLCRPSSCVVALTSSVNHCQFCLLFRESIFALVVFLVTHSKSPASVHRIPTLLLFCSQMPRYHSTGSCIVPMVSRGIHRCWTHVWIQGLNENQDSKGVSVPCVHCRNSPLPFLIHIPCVFFSLCRGARAQSGIKAASCSISR